MSNKPAEPDVPSAAVRREELLQDVAQGWRIEERPFQSSVPVIGPLIVAVRSAWVRMAARWYVLQLFEQQQAYNCTIGHLLSQHVQQLGDRELSIAALAERTARLETRILELEDLLMKSKEVADRPIE